MNTKVILSITCFCLWALTAFAAAIEPAPPAARATPPIKKVAQAQRPDLTARVLQIIQTHCPKAETKLDGDGNLVAKHGTMVFTVHSRGMGGEVYERTLQMEGPNFRGFLISIDRREGVGRGYQSMAPLTSRHPYWDTYHDRPATEDGKDHYFVLFSYGSRLDGKFKAALLDAIRSTVPNKALPLVTPLEPNSRVNTAPLKKREGEK